MRTLGLSILCAAWALCFAATGCGGGDTQDASIDAAVADGTIDSAWEAMAPVPCATTSPSALASCVMQSRYEQSLTQLAHVRPPGSAGWRSAQSQIMNELTAAGFAPEMEVYDQDPNRGVNIIARRPGAGNDWIVLSAHYDGVANCPAADDNGSGVAGVLEAARVLAGAHFEHGLILALWDEEESGLLGSQAFVETWNARGLGPIRYAVSLEMIGFRSDMPNSQTLPNGFEILFPAAAAYARADMARGNFIAVVHDAPATTFSDAFTMGADSFGLRSTTVPVPANLLRSSLLADLQRSDHAAFWNAGISAAMVTDTSNFRNPYYHCYGGSDSIDSINMEFATHATRAAVQGVAAALGVIP